MKIDAVDRVRSINRVTNYGTNYYKLCIAYNYRLFSPYKRSNRDIEPDQHVEPSVRTPRFKDMMDE